MVPAMRGGKTFIICLSKTQPDFTREYTADAETFPAAKVFDFLAWREGENYLKIVKEGENHDMMGGANNFYMSRDF